MYSSTLKHTQYESLKVYADNKCRLLKHSQQALLSLYKFKDCIQEQLWIQEHFSNYCTLVIAC